MIFLRDEVQTPSIFSVHTSLRAVADALADLFRITSPVSTAKGGRLIFNRMLCCCHRGARTKTFVIWLAFCTYDLCTHGASAFCSRLCIWYCSLPHKYVHTVCVWPMWCAVISIWHDHVHQAKSWLAGEKQPGNTRRPHKTSTAQQSAATTVWYSGLY